MPKSVHIDGSLHAHRRGGGFTVVELMVAIAVLAILLALAVPNFNDASLSARLNGFANSLVATRAVADLAAWWHPTPSAVEFQRAMEADLGNQREMEERL